MNYKIFCGDFYKEAKKSNDVLKRCEAVTSTAIEQDIQFATIIIMSHPVVDDDELSTSPIFLCSLWLTMNNHNSERHAICCDQQQVFTRTVERCHA